MKMLNGYGRTRQGAVLGIAALCVFTAVTVADAARLGPVSFAALYSIVVVMAGEIATRAGLFAIALVCGLLSILTWQISGGIVIGSHDGVQLAIGLAVLAGLVAILARTSPETSENLERLPESSRMAAIDSAPGDSPSLETLRRLTRSSERSVARATAALIAHELNQPLAAIVANAQAMNRWIDGEEIDVAAVRRITERLVRESLRASDIVSGSRSELSRSRGEPEAFSLRKLVVETVGLLCGDRHVGLVVVDAAMPAIDVRGVRTEIQQVLFAVLYDEIAAIGDAVASNGAIKVSAMLGEDRLVSVEVGRVLDDEAENECGRKTDVEENGSGPGLMVSRSLIEANGGTLKTFHDHDGGTEVVIAIPIEDPND